MIDPARLRQHYSAFLRSDRVLLTGHSHQAWPDVARAAQLEAFDDAARLVDDKWGPAFEAADSVRAAIASRIGAKADEIALAQNTHDLVIRFLSALDLREKGHVVTTTGEFHTIDRQLKRLAEDGLLEVTWVDAGDPRTLADRLASAVRSDTAAVLASTVLFQTSSIVPRLDELARVARSKGAHVLFDAYHAFNVVPFTLPHPEAFVVGGGYKYAQLGEGNCFLRVPNLDLRPVVTGWFAGFGALADPRGAGRVPYPARPCDRFAGSTYDPTSHYRARSVFRFFDEQGMTVDALRAASLRQTARILAGLEGSQRSENPGSSRGRSPLDVNGVEIATPRADAERAGFVSVRVKDAKRIHDALRAEHIFVDFRGDFLRLGPAPYLLDEELDRGIAAFARLARQA